MGQGSFLRLGFMRKNMVRICVMASLLVGLSALPAARAQSLIGDEELRGIGLSTYWTAQVPVDGGDEIRGAFLVDDHIYITTEFGAVFAVQAEMGLLRWAEQVGLHNETILRPSHIVTETEGSPVIIASTTAIRTLDRFTGELLATLRVPYPTGSPVIGVERRVFFGSSDSRFYSLIWSREGGGKWVKAWEVMAGGAVLASPVAYGDGKIVYGNLKGTVVSFYTEDKALDWTHKTDGAIEGDLAADDSGVYVASGDRSLYKFDPETGEILWRFRTDSPLNVGPALRLHTVYQYVTGWGLVAIDAHTGKEMWRNAKSRNFLAADKERDYLWTSEGTVEAVEHETGKLKGIARTNGSALPLSNRTGDAVFLVGKDGRILCARSSSGPYLRRREVDVAADRLNIAPRVAEEAPVELPKEKKPDPADEDPLRSRRDVRP